MHSAYIQRHPSFQKEPFMHSADSRAQLDLCTHPDLRGPDLPLPPQEGGFCPRGGPAPYRPPGPSPGSCPSATVIALQMPV